MSTKKIHAQPPEKLTGIEFKKIPSSAVGYKAIKSAITHIKEEVGLVKGIGLLAKLNQKNGFDSVLNVQYYQLKRLNLLW